MDNIIGTIFLIILPFVYLIWLAYHKADLNKERYLFGGFAVLMLSVVIVVTCIDLLSGTVKVSKEEYESKIIHDTAYIVLDTIFKK